MRKFLAPLTLLAALAALAVMVVAPAASASSMDRVPDSALTALRAVGFANPDPAALGDGWFEVADLAGITCIADPAGSGAMGYHWANGARLFDGRLDPSAPEAIVYERHPDGSFHVVALEYIVFQDQWGSTPPEFFPGHPFMATGADNRFGLPAYYSQHVWVGKGNPLGNLAMWNPAVHC
jgi:hypothetical protein